MHFAYPRQKKHKLCFSFMHFLFFKRGVRGGGKVCYGRLQVANKGIQDILIVYVSIAEGFTKLPAFCICFSLQQEILSGAS